MLTGILPQIGVVLEIGSGTGEHVAYFAEAFPHLIWQPSDPDPACRTSIASWIEVEELGNVRAPAAIDVREALWGVEDAAPFDAILSLNMIHIAPWQAALGLIAGAGRVLRPKGIFYLYGPFMVHGTHTAPSNAAFDADLKRRDPSWGVRDIDDLKAEAAGHGLEFRNSVRCRRTISRSCS